MSHKPDKVLQLGLSDTWVHLHEDGFVAIYQKILDDEHRVFLARHDVDKLLAILGDHIQQQIKDGTDGTT